MDSTQQFIAFGVCFIIIVVVRHFITHPSPKVVRAVFDQVRTRLTAKLIESAHSNSKKAGTLTWPGGYLISIRDGSYLFHVYQSVGDPNNEIYEHYYVVDSKNRVDEKELQLLVDHVTQQESTLL